MTGKVWIEELVVTEKFMRRKRLLQDRGELALIEDGQGFQHLGYFSLRKGAGYCRGGHFHRKKTEHFYIIRGKLRLELVDMESGERWEIGLNEGHRVVIYPLCAHRFWADEEAQVIEYYDAEYDPDDDVSYTEF